MLDLSGSTYSAFQGGKNTPFTRTGEIDFFQRSKLTNTDSKFIRRVSDAEGEVEDLNRDYSTMTLRSPRNTNNNATIRFPVDVKYEPIILPVRGFTFEIGKSNATSDRTLLFQPCNYKNWFYYSGSLQFLNYSLLCVSGPSQLCWKDEQIEKSRSI